MNPIHNRGSENIRPMTILDVDAVHRIEELCFPSPWSRESFLKEMRDNHLARYFVYEEEGKIIGYAGVWLIEDEGHITNVAVEPGHRGKGIGKELIVMMIEMLKSKRILRLTLEVRESNHVAIGLYHSLGFEIYGRRKNYYQKENEDALVMWKSLVD